MVSDIVLFMKEGGMGREPDMFVHLNNLMAKMFRMVSVELFTDGFRWSQQGSASHSREVVRVATDAVAVVTSRRYDPEGMGAVGLYQIVRDCSARGLVLPAATYNDALTALHRAGRLTEFLFTASVMAQLPHCHLDAFDPR